MAKNLIYKLLYLLITFLLIGMFNAFFVSGLISISCNPSSGVSGTTVTVPVRVQNSPYMEAFGFNFSYDTNMFTFQSAIRGTLTQDWGAFGFNSNPPGNVLIGGATFAGTPISAGSSGTIAIATFRVTCGGCNNGDISGVYIDKYIDDLSSMTPMPATTTFTFSLPLPPPPEGIRCCGSADPYYCIVGDFCCDEVGHRCDPTPNAGAECWGTDVVDATPVIEGMLCSSDNECACGSGNLECSPDHCCPVGENWNGLQCVASGPATCEEAGNSAQGDSYCANLDSSKPLCCGSAGNGHCEECCNLNECGFCERCATGGGQGTWNCVYQSASADLKNECPSSSYSCDTICERSRLSGDCDGAGACETEYDYITGGYVCSGGSEIFPTASDNCGVDTSNCNAGACSATIYNRACQANNGFCRDENNGATTSTVIANSGRSLTDTCGINGNTLCDNTWRCGTGSGNNNYGDGGQYRCQGLCDGSGICDYATNCVNCGAGTCTDSGDAWDVQDTVTVSGGCASGMCVAGSTNYDDYCEASGNNVVHDRQCIGNSLGSDATADCDVADTNTCWCTASISTLTEDCNDWDCNTGRCRDSGSNWNRNTWNCGAWRECTSETCQGNGYTCYRTNSGIWNWSSSAESTETACTDNYDNDCDGDTDRVDCDCGVSITSITAPPTADSGEVITVECGSSVGPVNCISATIGGRSCTKDKNFLFGLAPDSSKISSKSTY